MNCPRCGRTLASTEKHCLRCGAPRPDTRGVFRTSAVLVSTRHSHAVYSSIADMPVRLRTRVIESTSGGGAGTILIADRRGRREIARLVGNLSPAARRRLGQGEEEDPGTPGLRRWMKSRRKEALLVTAALLALLCALLIFVHAWK